MTKTVQLCFDEILYNLYVSNTCKNCKNECKVFCKSEKAVIYCNKYKNKKTNNLHKFNENKIM